MQKTGMKRHWASFMTLVLLSLFPFFSCEKAGPDNSETDKQENAENGKEPDGTFFGASLWINNSNRSDRESLVKEWLEKNKIR